MWIDGDGSYHFDALMIQFYNDWLATDRDEAPILRTAAGFKEKISVNLNYDYVYDVSLGDEGYEKIEFTRTLDRMLVTNRFYVDINGSLIRRVSELTLRKP